MEKIDRRKTYGIILDSETANGLDDPLFYDLGWQIIDSKGNCYERRSFVNADILLGEKELMKTAYYADKLPHYWDDIKDGKRILTSMYKIRLALLDDINNYGVEFVCAHNARFDYNSLNKTQRYLSKSKYRFFLPYNLVWYDTMRMARKCILTMPTYRKFCEENGFMTKHATPRPRLTAEVIYRFITQDVEFVEEHTGLEDVDIERQIFAYCRNTRRLPLNNCKLWED